MGDAQVLLAFGQRPAEQAEQPRTVGALEKCRALAHAKPHTAVAVAQRRKSLKQQDSEWPILAHWSDVSARRNPANARPHPASAAQRAGSRSGRRSTRSATCTLRAGNALRTGVCAGIQRQAERHDAQPPRHARRRSPMQPASMQHRCRRGRIDAGSSGVYAVLAPLLVIWRSARRPFRSVAGSGGQPGMCRSTGTTASTPPVIA